MGKAVDVDAADYEADDEVYWRIADALATSGSDEESIIDWNDRDGKTFPQIADALAERWGIDLATL